jgi:hypothetical protein
LLTFLLVQAVVSVSVAASAITRIRKDMKNLKKQLPVHGSQSFS